MIGLVCMANPDSQLTIAFIGDILGFSFSAEKVSDLAKQVNKNS